MESAATSAQTTTPLAPPCVVRRTFPRPAGRAWVRVGAAATEATVTLNGRRVGTHLGAWTPFEFEITPFLGDANNLEIACVDCRHTTDGFLPVTGIRWTGARDVEIFPGPMPIPAAARQRSSTRGTQLLVDGRPFRVRGILHWGYYPELGNPWPAESVMRDEIEYAKSLGFNLIKFCLWVPPPRYYELCDELGMFVWQEYPVWDAPLNDPAIKREYEEFFRLDGPHPCVILRTLSCENDRIDPGLGRELVDLCHEMVPGALVLDNSAWRCAERVGDFHDEHPYLNNTLWQYYGRRMRGKLTKPLLLGETMGADAPADEPHDRPIAVRRFQIETLARDLPDVGYVMNGMRDTKRWPGGIYTLDGDRKFSPAEWSWHSDEPAVPRRIPEAAGPIIGPRKGQWKCPEYGRTSPIVRVSDPSLPVKLIEDELVFDLLSGRVLEGCAGTRVLVELHETRFGRLRTLPMVIEFMSQGVRRIVSAFRHDTPAGRVVWKALAARTGDAPEIGPLVGTAIVLEDWEMSFDGKTWTPIKCDTPLVNGGRNVFEGWATFRSHVTYPGGPRILRCESVGDYYEIFIDGDRLADAGPRNGTWDGTRDIPRNFDVDLPAGRHLIEFHVRDWRAAGGMVGPVYFATDLGERVF